MRVLLTSLRSPFLDNDRVYPALANLYLKAALNEHSIDSDVTDDVDSIDLQKYSHIGVSIMTPQRQLSSSLLSRIKSEHPKAITIAGGPHANHYTEELLAEQWDYIVKGDGERVLPQIVSGKAGGARLLEDKLSRVELASMPRPDRLGNASYLGGYNYVLKGRNSTTMLTARGCSERCHFCEDAKTLVNKTPLEKIKQELDDIVELDYGGVYIFDDIFALAPKITEPICKELQARDLIYRCNGQARMMNEDFMRMLSETGCAEIAFGAETGSQTILDNIEKRTNISQNYNFVEWAHKYDIPLKLFILLGLPGEDRTTLQQTEDFIKASMPCDVQVAVYMPFRGTQIRDKIDRGEFVDLTINGQGEDGDVTGAYGVKGGESSYEVRTAALSAKDLQDFRQHLVETYRPKSHSKFLAKQRQEEDIFFAEGHI